VTTKPPKPPPPYNQEKKRERVEKSKKRKEIKLYPSETTWRGGACESHATDKVESRL